MEPAPRLYLLDDFASDEEIDHILRIAGDTDGLARRGISTQHSTAGFSCELPVQGDALVEAVCARTYDRLGMGNDLGRTLRFRRYLPGELHRRHRDVYELVGRRLIATAMLYLTDVEEGGETAFPDAQPRPIRIVPRRGRLAIWFNHRPDGSEDPAALHESLPVVRGVKASVANFIYKPVRYAANTPRLPPFPSENA